MYGRRRMRELFRFLHHIRKVQRAGGARRAVYAVWHIVGIVLAFVFAYFTYWLCVHIGELLATNIFVGIFGVIGIGICAVMAVVCFLQGVVAQIATIIFASVAIKKDPEGRAGNIAAVIIGAIGFIFVIVAAVIVFVFIL